MNMRKQFVSTVEQILGQDESVSLLLGDIGVFGFKNAFELFPKRVLNIGILEQSTVGLAAGLAKMGMVPIVHTIAPFLVERSFEQLKLDFGYQKLSGNFVSVGASFDYAALGCTHHCPADVSLLLGIPTMRIFVPGTSAEFHQLFSENYNSGYPNYFRLSEKQNKTALNCSSSKLQMIKDGKKAMVLVIGPLLDEAMEACHGLDVALVYTSSVFPFENRDFSNISSGHKRIMVVEPFYSGTTACLIAPALFPRAVTVDYFGIPREFLTNYGTREQHAERIGHTAAGLKKRLEALLEEN